MSDTVIEIRIPEKIWTEFCHFVQLNEDSDYPGNQYEFRVDYAEQIIHAALRREVRHLMAKGPYKAISGLVYYCGEEGFPVRLADDEDVENPRDQSNATRKAKRLNRKLSLAMMDSAKIEAANNGALIV